MERHLQAYWIWNVVFLGLAPLASTGTTAVHQLVVAGSGAGWRPDASPALSLVLEASRLLMSDQTLLFSSHVHLRQDAKTFLAGQVPDVAANGPIRDTFAGQF